jgi:hypothetical protein
MQPYSTLLNKAISFHLQVKLTKCHMKLFSSHIIIVKSSYAPNAVKDIENHAKSPIKTSSIIIEYMNTIKYIAIKSTIILQVIEDLSI